MCAANIRASRTLHAVRVRSAGWKTILHHFLKSARRGQEQISHRIMSQKEYINLRGNCTPVPRVPWMGVVNARQSRRMHTHTFYSRRFLRVRMFVEYECVVCELRVQSWSVYNFGLRYARRSRALKHPTHTTHPT